MNKQIVQNIKAALNKKGVIVVIYGEHSSEVDLALLAYKNAAKIDSKGKRIAFGTQIAPYLNRDDIYNVVVEGGAAMPIIDHMPDSEKWRVRLYVV